MIRILLLFAIICLMGCSSSGNSEIVNILDSPKVAYINDIVPFNVDSSDVLQMFYEKFGFPDECENISGVISVESYDFNRWKKLPISVSDNQIINTFENKTDNISGDSLKVSRIINTTFQDIWIRVDFYLRDNENPIYINLNEGYYQISNNRLLIYNLDQKLLYFENHSCR